MSADLWEAFGGGDASTNPWSQASPREEKTYTQPLPSVTSHPVQEEASSSTKPQHGSPAAQSPWDSDFTANLTAESKTTNALHNNGWTEQLESDANWSDFVDPVHVSDSWARSQPFPATEVLWDADQAINEDDDFGDFEDPLPDDSKLRLELLDPQKQASTLNIATVAVPKTSSVSSSAAWKDHAPIVAPGEHRTPKASQNDTHLKRINSTVQDRPIKEQLPEPDESWDEWSPDPRRKTGFSDKSQSNIIPTKITTTQSKTIASSNSGQSSSIPQGQSSGSLNRSQPTSSLPPTNIPPPSILISLLSSLVSTLPAQVEAVMESFTSKDSPTSAADKALSNAVRKCLAALRVAARIVAGRKLRWKRDTHLSQSMSIGPASSGGKSGMKLAGVDRTEIKREDREVAEFVIVWQNRLGSVRKALTSVNSRIGDASQSSHATTTNKKLELPSISDAMLIKTVKEEDGGIKSTKPCALCGVKREERVEKVDIEVFDGFGEWWYDHWGHAECRVFWYQHEKYLQQR